MFLSPKRYQHFAAMVLIGDGVMALIHPAKDAEAWSKVHAPGAISCAPSPITPTSRAPSESHRSPAVSSGRSISRRWSKCHVPKPAP